MEFNTLVLERRTVRSYAPDKTVTNDQLREIIAAAQQAPSWKNSQTARYYAAVSPEAIAAVTESLPDFNKNSSKNACALIVTAFQKDISGFNSGTPVNELKNEWGAYDLGLANSYLILKARDMGFDTLIMGIRDADVLRKVFSIPANEAVVSVIALGYRAAKPAFRPRRETDEVLTIK